MGAAIATTETDELRAYELAVEHLQSTMLAVSATDESRRFWLRQGLHDLPHCTADVASAMRALEQRGARYGFFHTTFMAKKLPASCGQPRVDKAAVPLRAPKMIMKPMKNSNEEEEKKMNNTTQWIQNRSIKMNKHNACTLRALD